MLGVGLAIAAVEKFPMPAFDGVCLVPPAAHACLGYAPALLADFLAPLARHAREEVFEIAVAGVVPVKLYRAPDQHAAFHEMRELLLRRE